LPVSPGRRSLAVRDICFPGKPETCRSFRLNRPGGFEQRAATSLCFSLKRFAD
jgi:hypothetical protein